MPSSLGDTLGNQIECVAEGLGHTVRCANKDCKQPLMQFHGIGMVRLLIPCPACGRHTMIRSTAEAGLNVYLLPRKAAAKSGA